MSGIRSAKNILNKLSNKILEERKNKTSSNSPENIDNEDITNELVEFSWQEKLLDVVKRIDPYDFERLCQRMLRELGFMNVEVTQQSNDGGIDGKGMIRLGGVMSFHVVFQAKRYQDSVSSSTVRDFRGSIIGRADKGLIITTGSFTREATKEAQKMVHLQLI